MLDNLNKQGMNLCPIFKTQAQIEEEERVSLKKQKT